MYQVRFFFMLRTVFIFRYSMFSLQLSPKYLILDWPDPDLSSSFQPPAGCWEQVWNEPGHLGQGAFCFHRHWRAGLPHHRRGQHSQRRRPDPPWCEPACLLCFLKKASYPPELLKGLSRWPLLTDGTISISLLLYWILCLLLLLYTKIVICLFALFGRQNICYHPHSTLFLF